MAHYQCRICDFDGHAGWTGELVCPRCGKLAGVRAAIATEEMTDAELAMIEAEISGGTDTTGADEA